MPEQQIALALGLAVYIIVTLLAAGFIWAEHAHWTAPGWRGVALSIWVGLWWPVLAVSVTAWLLGRAMDRWADR
jgi:hypothetical protein